MIIVLNELRWEFSKQNGKVAALPSIIESIVLYLESIFLIQFRSNKSIQNWIS